MVGCPAPASAAMLASWSASGASVLRRCRNTRSGAVGVGCEQRLVGDRQDPAALLARALRDELLGPDPEGAERVVDDEGELVAAGARELAEREPEPQARVVLGRLEVRARLLGDLRALEDRPHVDAGQRGGDEPEVRERRVAPADLRVVEERAAEAVLLGEVDQRRAGVGDGDEVAAVALQRVEVLEQRQRLDRAARLRRDDEQRRREVDLGRRRPRSAAARSSRARAGAARPRARRRRAGRPRARGSSRPCRAARRRSARRPCTRPRRRRARRPPRASCRRSSASRGGR